MCILVIIIIRVLLVKHCICTNALQDTFAMSNDVQECCRLNKSSSLSAPLYLHTQWKHWIYSSEFCGVPQLAVSTTSTIALPVSMTVTSYQQNTCKNFGAYFNASMIMAIHGNRLIRTCFYQLRRMQAIRQSIPTSTAVQLINSFVISRIDYCNSLLAGLPAYQLDRVQSILKFVTCLIYGRAKYDQITPILRNKLHWLRVPPWIQYKCCLLVYTALHGLAPGYISNFCKRVWLSDCRSSLRSANRSHNKLVVPRSSKFGEWSRTISGSSVMNSLPDQVMSAPSFGTFKDRLKTHLFSLLYFAQHLTVF